MIVLLVIRRLDHAFYYPGHATTPRKHLDGWVEIGAYPGESRIFVTGGVGTHSTRVRSGFSFSTTYVVSSAALLLPAFLTAWIVPAGTSKTSPALSVVGGLPSIGCSSEPSRTWMFSAPGWVFLSSG